LELKRIDHVGIVVRSLEEHVAQLEALGRRLARTNAGVQSQFLVRRASGGDK
jgi:hypothetical protein